MVYDAIVIGAGTAGITAAVYLKRGGAEVLVIEKMFVGGQILNAPLVENVPGFGEGISGVDFSFNLKNQAEALKIPIKYEEVVKTEIDKKVKTVYTSRGEYLCKNIIFATGAEHKKLGLEDEEKYIGGGISYCAVCDGAFYKNKAVLTVGGGNSAAREALYLSELCSKVYLVHRREFLRAERALVKKLEEKENIEIIYNATVKSLSGNPVEAVVLATDMGERVVEVKGVFVAVGSLPQNNILDKSLLDESGYAETDENMLTKKDGVYAVGDLREKNKKQLVFAASDGALAAEHIISKLQY